MKALVLGLICVAATTSALAADPQVPYPQGYRDWHHVKSMVIEEGHPMNIRPLRVRCWTHFMGGNPGVVEETALEPTVP